MGSKSKSSSSQQSSVTDNRAVYDTAGGFVVAGSNNKLTLTDAKAMETALKLNQQGFAFQSNALAQVAAAYDGARGSAEGSTNLATVAIVAAAIVGGLAVYRK